MREKIITTCPECRQDVRLCGRGDNTKYFDPLAGQAKEGEKRCTMCGGKKP